MRDYKTIRRLTDFDWLLFAGMLAVIAVGVTFITSGSELRATEPHKQILFAMVGLAVFFIAIIPHHEHLERHAYVFYYVVLAVLAALLLFGHHIGVNRVNRSCRWIRVGGINVQPSEFMKIAFVAAMARYLMYRKNYRTLKGLVIPLVMTLAPTWLILREPDLGTSLLFLPVFFVMLYIAGAKTRHLATLAATGLAIMLLAFFADDITGKMAERGVIFSRPVKLLAPYQKARITHFITGKSYQQRQSVIAVGSGGLLGKGWRRGTQNRYNLLPERHTDFIFAVIAEESGFVGGVGLLALYGLILLAAFGTATQTGDPFGRLLVVGLVSSITIQILINAAMTIRLMPITGLTLPLVSYGGSSLTTTMLALALIVNVRLHPTATFARKVFDFDDETG